MDSNALFDVEDETSAPAVDGSRVGRRAATSDQGELFTTETEATAAESGRVAAIESDAERADDAEPSGDVPEEPNRTGDDNLEPPLIAFADQPAQGAAGLRPARLALLVLVYAAGVLLFLAVEPTRPWILLAATGLVAVGADGIIRTHPGGEFEGDVAGTAPYLFLPALYALGSGLFLEDVATGYWAVPGVFMASVLMWLFMYAEYVSVDERDHLYPFARLILNIGTYLTAFAFFAVVYTFDVSLVPAAIAVGLVTLLLSVEVLREAEADPVRALVYAAVIGVVVAEARWDLYFLPLESYLAAVFLLLVFYLGSGLVQHHLTEDLRPPVVAEFLAIAIIGILIVAIGRIFESTVTLGP